MLDKILAGLGSVSALSEFIRNNEGLIRYVVEFFGLLGTFLFTLLVLFIVFIIVLFPIFHSVCTTLSLYLFVLCTRHKNREALTREGDLKRIWSTLGRYLFDTPVGYYSSFGEWHGALDWRRHRRIRSPFEDYENDR